MVVDGNTTISMKERRYFKRANDEIINLKRSLNKTKEG